MIYTATFLATSGKAPLSFQQQGITRYVPAKMGDVPLLAKPFETQIAYGGYKDNLEAFLHATEIGKKVLCGQAHYAISPGYNPTFPLSPPKFIFELDQKGKKLDLNAITRMEEAGKTVKMLKVNYGKGRLIYTVEKPTWEFFLKIARIALPETIRQDGMGQVRGVGHVLRVYQAVDLFLRTNTYYWKGPPEQYENISPPKSKRSEDQAMEMRFGGGSWYESHKDEKYRPHKMAKGDEGGMIVKETDGQDDLTPFTNNCVVPSSIVAVAKPSPKPYTVSCGTPASVPFEPGVLFPYFKGLNHPDVNFLRSTVSRHFFRCFGSTSESDARAGFMAFRDAIGLVASTDEGVALTHIMKGVDMAMEAQAHLYLLFDKHEYLGFTLLGNRFWVVFGGEKQEVKTAKDLKAELAGILTHESALVELTAKLGSATLKDGEMMEIPDGGITCCRDLAIALSKVAITDDNEDEIDALARLLTRVNFTDEYRTMKPKLIAEVVTGLLDPDLPIPVDWNFYIPSRGWDNIGRRDYMLFASFGSQSFSFINQKGEDIAVPSSSKEKDCFLPSDAKNSPYAKMVIYSKPINQCMQDWEKFCGSGKMRMDFGERAGGSRAYVLRVEDVAPLWSVLKDAAAAGKIGKGSKGKDKAAAVPESLEVFAAGNIEDLF